MAKTEISALQRAISTVSRSLRNPKALPFDPQGDLRHFHVFGGHVTTFENPIIGNFKNFIPVKYHTKRFPEINSSDTGNLLKTRISDLLQLLEGEALPTELLTRLRRHQETGPPAPAILLMSVHHTTAQRIHTTPARTKQMPERKKPMPNNASTN